MTPHEKRFFKAGDHALINLVVAIASLAMVYVCLFRATPPLSLRIAMAAAFVFVAVGSLRTARYWWGVLAEEAERSKREREETT